MTVNMDFKECPRCRYEVAIYTLTLETGEESWFCPKCGYAVDKMLTETMQEFMSPEEKAHCKSKKEEGTLYTTCGPNSIGAYGILWEDLRLGDIAYKKTSDRAVGRLMNNLSRFGAVNNMSIFGAGGIDGGRGVLTRRLSDEEIKILDDTLKESGILGYVTVWDEEKKTVTVVAGDFEVFTSIVDIE